MFTLAFTIKQHTQIRLEEVAGLLTAIAGAVMVLPMGMMGGRRFAGLCLAVAGVLWVVAIHWG